MGAGLAAAGLDRGRQVIRRPKAAARGDALARRHIAQWRRITARLQVLMNADSTAIVLTGEAHALRCQCERLAADLGQAADRARLARSPGDF